LAHVKSQVACGYFRVNSAGKITEKDQRNCRIFANPLAEPAVFTAQRTVRETDDLLGC